MYVLALATDYDGTLAEDCVVSPSTIEALERFKETGRRLIMVTGRELPELIGIFPKTELFDRIVAENGALLYDPATRTETPLAASASPELFDALKARGVIPLSMERCIIATREPHHIAALEEIRRLGLELEITFNKGAVMVSRIIGKDPETGVLPSDPDSQAVLCFQNLKRVLEAGGMDLGDVVKLTVYLVSDSYRSSVNKPWHEHFPDPEHRPTRDSLVMPLRGGNLIQIEAWAVAKELG